ncbi:DUF3408 domain-containing protein [Bacteroides sp. 224]|uniref:DUF3408 domain-containing protein n=1 Tax=Bacteroides sp. 224 TaxID=2302936 RepID=UPI0013D7671A|nr:DUF3408 domain-containing protein [Bacteroides sp. 224]NDV64674.1 DUF3408 domain-containing protein [Bacteroides sp. 224]
MNRFKKKELEESMEKTTSFAERYLKPIELDRRQCVYISKRNHKILTDFIRSLNEKGLTIGGYIDNVITEHIDKHKEEINYLYRRERNDLV